MTFTEFFHKKKIDLVQLQNAEPGLFAEFKSHYNQMGEKSFDHSKKFWFNKLRKIYHLKVEPKPAKVIIELNPIASQAEPLSSPEPEVKKGFSPRFKAKTIVNHETIITEEKTNLEEPKSEADSPKPAFKPRFKPQMAKPLPISPIDSEPNESIKKVEEEAKPEQTKPAYIPRFKAPVTEPIDHIPEEKIADEAEPKPVYKPRFKPQMVKPSEPSIENEKTAESTPEEQVTELPMSDSDPVDIAQEAPKPAFKPKFTPRNFKPKSE